MRPPNMTYLTDVYFECGAVRLLPDLLMKFSMQRPLIVTDRGLINSGLVHEKLSGAAAQLLIFDGVETNPTERSALAALSAYRELSCDGIVAFGGGSPIDLAKLVALLVHHTPPLEQYAIVKGGVERISSMMPPLIAVPTTAGSGSEVGRAALLTLSSGDKLGFLSPHLLPKAVICDPELTIGMPPALTAGTGMDAISHCVETFCSPRVNPAADALSLDGLSRGYRNIQRATHDSKDIAARSEMMLCSLLAGLAFQKGLGAVHSLSHPLGSLTEKRLHHGTLNAIFLPHVLRFNAAACIEKFGVLAQTMGLASGKMLPEAFESLNRSLNLPAKLSQLGVTKADIALLAEKALHDHCTPTNPRAMTLDDCRALYELAF